MNSTLGKLLALAALLLTASVQADVYRWTDAQGRTHYGDRPPAEGAEKIVEPPPPSGLSADEAKARLDAIRAQQEAAAEDRAKAREERAKADAERKQTAQECAAARRQLDSMRAAQRVRDEQGNWYTGEQRLEKQRELEQAIGKRCGGQ
ncbi:MAG: DUF4124 domain-containing protein [Pseudomonadota bacterium]